MKCFKCHKHDQYANECKYGKFYDYGKVNHFVKYCRAKKKEKNLLIEKNNEELGICLLQRTRRPTLQARD